MRQYTYQDLIRKYSEDVARGYADTDLTPRQRRLVVAFLNIASNETSTLALYPPSEQTRIDAKRHLGDVLWNAGHLVMATSPGAGGDYDTARSLACEILEGI